MITVSLVIIRSMLNTLPRCVPARQDHVALATITANLAGLSYVGGRVWAEGKVGEGATWTLRSQSERSQILSGRHWTNRSGRDKRRLLELSKTLTLRISSLVSLFAHTYIMVKVQKQSLKEEVSHESVGFSGNRKHPGAGRA